MTGSRNPQVRPYQAAERSRRGADCAGLASTSAACIQQHMGCDRFCPAFVQRGRSHARCIWTCALGARFFSVLIAQYTLILVAGGGALAILLRGWRDIVANRGHCDSCCLFAVAGQRGRSGLDGRAVGQTMQRYASGALQRD